MMLVGIWTIVVDHSHDGLDHLGVVERFDGFGHKFKKVYDGLDHLGLGVVDR